MGTTLVGEEANESSVTGFWQTMDDKTGRPQSIVALYPYRGLYFGRMVVTFDDSGKLSDTINDPKDRAPGVVGNPYYSGMDIIWDMKKEGSKYVGGKIIDPEKGDIYDAEMWLSHGRLIVRGEILFFGENQTWLPAVESDFPPNFKKPDLNQFIPVIPTVKH
ncbi:MAG: DUF2147 domain-containing protein [Chlamydiales bacterium]